MKDLRCFKCNLPIVFGELVSKTGKKVPLNPSTSSPHQCPENKTYSVETRLHDLEMSLDVIKLQLKNKGLIQ